MAKKKSKTKSATKKGRPKHRASWSGQLRFGLVSMPVQAFNVHLPERGEIHFHQLHAGCHQRIHYQKVCPIHGELDNDEIVSGYEYKKGEYIEIDPDELDALRSDAERALTLDTFIDADLLDPLYHDGRRYYLLPDGKSASEPYTVLAAAMHKKGRDAIGQVVFSGRQQLVRLRSVEGLLVMAMLDYSAEVQAPETVAAKLPSARAPAKSVQLAEMLVEAWADKDFDIDAYKDTYRAQVKELIDAKVAGEEIVAPEPEEQPQVINLMDALQKSLERNRPASKKAKSHSRRGGAKKKRRRAS